MKKTVGRPSNISKTIGQEKGNMSIKNFLKPTMAILNKNDPYI